MDAAILALTAIATVLVTLTLVINVHSEGREWWAAVRSGFRENRR